MIDPTKPDFTNTPVSANRPVFLYRPCGLGEGADSAEEAGRQPPLVTLITPFYNTSEIFYETAKTILGQSFQQWEWLIINDGSTEPKSLEILAEFRQSDPRIHVIDHEHNRGLSAARNTGFRDAQTDYVLQIDSDDLLEPTALEKWAWGLVAHPEYAFIKGYSLGFGAQEYTWTHGFHDRELFLTENPVNATCMIRKSVHTAVGGYAEGKTGGLEDWDFWLNCAAHGFWGGTIPEFHDWYRLRPDHRQRWADWNAQRIAEFLEQARLSYPVLWQHGFPTFPERETKAITAIPQELPFQNQLAKTKKRLLLILPWLQMGGADKMNLDLACQLVKRDWEVSIIATMNGDQSWAPVFEQITPDVFILSNFLEPADYPRFIHYFAKSRQVDAALIANSHFSYLALPYLRQVLPEIPWLTLCHMELENGVFGAYPEIAVKQQAYIDLNLTVSSYLKQVMLEHGMDPRRVEVLYANIDAEAWEVTPAARAVLRQALGIPDSTAIILYPARLGAQKQPQVFLHAIHLLKEQGLEFKALVVGDGPDLVWMVQTAAETGIGDHVLFAGAQPANRMPDFFGAADIFFLPSQWEGIAITLYEAMATGLPVVGADVGGQRELATPEVGFLVKRSNPTQEAEEYAQLLAQLIQDPTLRREMGQRSRERVRQKFRLDQMIPRFEELVNQAIRLHLEMPQPVPESETAYQSAVTAAEFARAVRTWQPPQSSTEDGLRTEHVYNPIESETRLYRAIKRALMPSYQFATARRWNFIYPIKELFRNIINRKRPD